MSVIRARPCDQSSVLLERFRRMRRTTMVAISVCLIGSVNRSLAAPAASQPRVCMLAPDTASRHDLERLHASLPTFELRPTLAGLRECDAALFFRGPGALAAADANELHEFIRAGKPLVVLAADADAWPSEPKFQTEVLGALRKGLFAGGAPMTVINVFPHPICTGASGFETNESMPLFDKLADDAQIIIEGTVGEATAPIAWVRRHVAGRMVHIVPASAVAFSNPVYQQLVRNSLLWTLGRPIPEARPAVQRTFMPEAYPGAFAITFPNGPGVCLDPVRGGINYIWNGDFVDLRPRWITKQGEPARIAGEVYYREQQWQPLRGGAPGRESDFQFRGYTLHDGYPEFHYEIDGREVHERLTSASDGGLQRRFRVGAGTTPLWLTLEPQPDAEVTVSGLERDGNVATFSSAAGGEFTIEIRRKAVRVP
jgi:hypothetical protein